MTPANGYQARRHPDDHPQQKARAGQGSASTTFLTGPRSLAALIEPSKNGPLPLLPTKHRFVRLLRSFRGRRFAAKGQPPLLPLLLPFLAHTVVLESRWHCCGSFASSRTGVSAFGRRVGLGATPLHPRDGRPGNGRLLPPLLPRSGSLPARACGASDPCGKATNPPARRVEEAVGDVSGRRVVLAADTGIEPPLTEAAHDLVARLQGIGEPVGLPLAEGGLARPRDAGGDHNGAPLSRERIRAGVRGRRPRFARCSRSGARGRGFRRGASPPSPEPKCLTLGMLAYAQVASRLWRSSRP